MILVIHKCGNNKLSQDFLFFICASISPNCQTEGISIKDKITYTILTNAGTWAQASAAQYNLIIVRLLSYLSHK